MVEKRFQLNHVIRNVRKLKNEFSKKEENFGAIWFILVSRRQDALAVFLNCWRAGKTKKTWAIEVDFKIRLISRTENLARTFSVKFEEKVGHGRSNFVSWEDVINKHMVDNTITIECDVIIKEMRGFPPERKMNFDEPKDNLTDVILEVGGKKFHVSKVYLATHSPIFNAMFFGNEEELTKSEFQLEDVNAEDFYSILETIHGHTNLTDDNVSGVLQLANKFDMERVFDECEEFLLKTPRVDEKEKFRLADAYKLKNLEKRCLESIKSLDQLRRVVPKNIDDLDSSTLSALLHKCVYQF